jgi:hypothetical protein
MPDERRLPAAVRAGEDDPLAVVDVERDAVEDPLLAVGVRQFPDRDHSRP